MVKHKERSGRDPDRGYKWISRVEDITNPDDLQDSEGRNLLGSKVAAAFSKILHGALGEQIQLLEEKAEADKRLLKCRQTAWYIKDYFKLNAEHGEVLDFADLNAVKMQGTNISRFLHDWESVLLAINKIPDEVIMESLVFGQVEKADALKSMLELYRLDVPQNGKPKSYERLLDMLQKHILERRRRKNRDEYTQGGRSRSASPGFVGDKGSKGKSKGKGKTGSKGKSRSSSREQGDCRQ